MESDREPNTTLQMLRNSLTFENVDEVLVQFGWTALEHALWHGYVDCVKYCVEMGADVNIKTFDGFTPLLIAVMKDSIEIVNVLLDAGALIDTPVENGCTALYFAIGRKQIDIAKLLIDRGARVSNVILGGFVPSIPDCLTTFIVARSNCQWVSVIIIGIHKYHRTRFTCGNDINVLKLVSKHIWSTRFDEV
jgi:hypothetical protein